MRATAIFGALALPATQVASGAAPNDTTAAPSVGRASEPPAQSVEPAPSAPRTADMAITLSSDDTELSYELTATITRSDRGHR